MPHRFLAIAIWGLFLVVASSAADREEGAPIPKPQILGSVEIDDHSGIVLFHDPADDGKSYRVSVAISKPWKSPSIKGERVDVWLLARGGKALQINKEMKGDVLLEAGSRGATASAIYFFDRSVEPGELVAAVVSIDGVPKAFPISSPKLSCE